MKFAVIEFPGSNCDHDAYHATKHVLGQQAEFVWHKETDLRRVFLRRLPADGRDRQVFPGDGLRL